jgi:hypothetical protein
VKNNGLIMKQRFFSQHARSSALVTSLGIHALLIVLAVSFVAVTVIRKEDQQFGNIINAFDGDGSVIYDITKYMTDEEQTMYRNYLRQ